MRVLCFWENWLVSDNIWAWEQCIFKELTFFMKIWALEQWFFSWKIRKKGHHTAFLTHNIVKCWESLRFSALQKLKKKKTWEHCDFERMDIFWQSIFMRILCFLENGSFFSKKSAWEECFFRENRIKEHPVYFFRPYTIV